MKICSAFVIVFILASCGDKDVVVIDTTAPLVDTIAPDRNQEYAPGDTVFIHALLSDDQQLWKGGVHIHDPDTVFNYEFLINEPSFEIDTFWIVNDLYDKTYRIYVDGFDKAENLTSQQRLFFQRH